MPKGGARAGAGRKKKLKVALKDLPKHLAVEILEEKRARIKERLAGLIDNGDDPLFLRVFQMCDNRAHGLPSQAVVNVDADKPGDIADRRDRMRQLIAGLSRPAK